jgi:hypothetical protein
MNRAHPVRRAYDFLTEHWVLSALILSIPSELYAVFQIAGTGIGLVGANGRMTGWGHAIFWPALVLSFGVLLYKTRADKYDDRSKSNAQFVLQRVLDSVNAATAKKLARFTEYIERHRADEALSPFLEITQPKAQIENIIENIQVALGEIAGIPRSDIGVGLLFRLGGNEWSWLHSVNTEHDLPLETLLKDSRTSIRQIIDGHAFTLFFADKRDGAGQGKYLPGPRDAASNGIGSILCRDISLGPRDCLQAILSVTTYGNQLCDVHSAGTQHAIETLVMPSFESRLRLELSLLYIRMRTAAAEASAA